MVDVAECWVHGNNPGKITGWGTWCVFSMRVYRNWCFVLIGGECWMKKNDLAKMRQAGTAPATGTTICCLTSLWCAVIHKRCSAMCYYQHISASECAFCTSIGLVSVGSTVLSI